MFSLRSNQYFSQPCSSINGMEIQSHLELGIEVRPQVCERFATAESGRTKS